MDSELTKTIESNEDEHFILVRWFIDQYIMSFNMDCTLELRNEMVVEVFKLIQKKYLASPNAKFKNNKRAAIATVVKSYLTRKISKDKKDLENQN